jgi:hypothetical protein
MRLRPGLVALAGALTLAFAGPAYADGPAAVQVTSCQTADHTATFEGRMNRVKGTVRMSMRFRLLATAGNTAQSQEIKSPKLSAWHSSTRGVKRFVYAQTVKGLAEGVTYRTVVQFRWFNAAGKVIRRAEEQSTACIQDGDLPNLVMSAVQVQPGSTPDTAVYTLTILNDAKGDAGPFDVGLIVDGALPDSRKVDGLKAGASTTVRITGPACSALRAVVDRDRVVTETVEDDNALRKRC